jgi:hypothetical protein
LDEATDVVTYKTILSQRVLKLLAGVLILSTIIGSFLPGEIKMLLGTQAYDPMLEDIALAQHLHPMKAISLAHRGYHFATFGSTTFVLMMLAQTLWGETAAVAFTFGLGLLIEIVQRLIGFSSVFEWWDVRDDLYAVTIAFVLTQGLNRFTRSARPN